MTTTTRAHRRRRHDGATTGRQLGDRRTDAADHRARLEHGRIDDDRDDRHIQRPDQRHGHANTTTGDTETTGIRRRPATRTGSSAPTRCTTTLAFTYVQTLDIGPTRRASWYNIKDQELVFIDYTARASATRSTDVPRRCHGSGRGQEHRRRRTPTTR